MCTQRKETASISLGANELNFIHFPIVDLSVPSTSALEDLIEQLDQQVRSGHGVYVHCWGGRGRSGIIGACLISKLYRWCVVLYPCVGLLTRGQSFAASTYFLNILNVSGLLAYLIQRIFALQSLWNHICYSNLRKIISDCGRLDADEALYRTSVAFQTRSDPGTPEVCLSPHLQGHIILWYLHC